MLPIQIEMDLRMKPGSIMKNRNLETLTVAKAIVSCKEKCKGDLERKRLAAILGIMRIQGRFSKPRVIMPTGMRDP